MEQISGTLHLRRGRAKPVRNKHPWLFSGSIYRVEGDPQAGDLVNVVAAGGEWLATAYFNPHSQIRARILSWTEGEAIDEAWWRSRVEEAISGRDLIPLAPHTTAYRLINAEADGLPGLIVDRYDDFLVVQCLALGIDRRKEMLVDVLAEMEHPAGIVERSDRSTRQKEGMQEATGVLWGQSPPDEVLVRENGHRFAVNLMLGHKTGFYLDQRDNRALVGERRFVAGKEVLNAFAYTGGFAVYAAAGGANAITNLDTSEEVLALAKRNQALNEHSRPGDEYVVGDAFKVLREYRDTGRKFDVVILDPPKFAHSKRDVEGACRGYKDLNWLAMRILRPGGILATFSCSGLVSADLFQKVVFGAAVDAGRDGQILYQLSQGPDHPIRLTFPESAYLKGFLIRVI